MRRRAFTVTSACQTIPQTPRQRCAHTHFTSHVFGQSERCGENKARIRGNVSAPSVGLKIFHFRRGASAPGGADGQRANNAYTLLCAFALSLLLVTHHFFFTQYYSFDGL